MDAENILNDSAKEAEVLLNNPSKVDEILTQMEEKLRKVPALGNTLGDTTLMIQMIKSYITKQYTNVSGKVIVTMVGACLYCVKKRDLIPDYKPIIGLVDDLAVLSLALKINNKELEEFKKWRSENYNM